VFFVATCMQYASPTLSSWIFVHPYESVQTAKIVMLQLSPSSSYVLPLMSKYAPQLFVLQRTRCVLRHKTRGKTVACYTGWVIICAIQILVINICKYFCTKRLCTEIIIIIIIMNIVIIKYEHYNKCLSWTHTQNIFTLFVDILGIAGYSILAVLFELVFTFPTYGNYLCTLCFLKHIQRK
jgi:hypothetical protein